MKVDLGRGTPTWVAPRRDNGVVLHQGSSRVHLSPEELDAVLTAIFTMTGKSGKPHGAEKNNVEPTRA